MPTPPLKRGGWTAIFVAAVLVFGGGYGAAYLALVERVSGAFTNTRSGAVPFVGAAYPHPALSKVFAPAHWLDRRIRPDFWEPPP